MFKASAGRHRSTSRRIAYRKPNRFTVLQRLPCALGKTLAVTPFSCSCCPPPRANENGGFPSPRPATRRPNGCRTTKSETRRNRRVQSTYSFFKDEHPCLVWLPSDGSEPRPFGELPTTRGQPASASRFDDVQAFSSRTRPDDRTSDAPSSIPRGCPLGFDLACHHGRSRVRTRRYPRQGRLPLRRFPREGKGRFTVLPPFPEPHTIHHGPLLRGR